MSDNAADDLEADPQAFMRDQRRKRRRVWVLSTVAVLLAGGAFGAGLWTAYQVGYEHGAQQAAPVITSESETVRVQPEDEGGREVENEDSEVYALLEEEGEGGQTEELLVPEEGETPAEGGDGQASGDGPSDDATGDQATSGEATGGGSQDGSAGPDAGTGSGGEEDIAVESLDEPAQDPSFDEGQGEDEIETLISEEVEDEDSDAGGESGSQADGGDGGTSAAQTAETETGGTSDDGAGSGDGEASATGGDTATAQAGSTGGGTRAGEGDSAGDDAGGATAGGSAESSGETQVAARESEGPSQPEAKPADTGATEEGWRIQVGSVPERSTAESEWQRLQSRYDDVLGDLEPRYQRADLGEDGIYHRIQAGPLAEARARQICDRLSEQDQGCLVIAP